MFCKVLEVWACRGLYIAGVWKIRGSAIMYTRRMFSIIECFLGVCYRPCSSEELLDRQTRVCTVHTVMVSILPLIDKRTFEASCIVPS